MIEGVGRLFIFLGGLLLLLGIVMLLMEKTGFKLPGDIIIRKGNFTFFFPLVSFLLLSLILTIILNIILRLLK